MENNIYSSHTEKNSKHTENYTKTANNLFRYLAYRDIESIISRYHKRGKIALDYGCGTGISTEFIQSFNFEVHGIDISKEMLKIAKKKCPNVDFQLIRNNIIPFQKEFFDLIFSSFVLFEISNKDDIIKYLKEAKKALKKNGIVIAITGNEQMYSGNWIIMNNNFPENQNVSSGQLVKISLPENNMVFTDYYWTNNDYKECIELAGFRILYAHYPKGKNKEPYRWKDERKMSPFVIFVLGPI